MMLLKKATQQDSIGQEPETQKRRGRKGLIIACLLVMAAVAGFFILSSITVKHEAAPTGAATKSIKAVPVTVTRAGAKGCALANPRYR